MKRFVVYELSKNVFGVAALSAIGTFPSFGMAVNVTPEGEEFEQKSIGHHIAYSGNYHIYDWDKMVSV